jgi:putative DNA primase/helicase
MTLPKAAAPSVMSALREAIPPRPSTLPPSVAAIPAELRSVRAWICWKLSWRDGKWVKEPVNPYTGGLAATDDPQTWSDFDTAVRRWRAWGLAGIGLCRTGDYVFVDLDGVLDTNGNLLPLPWARKTLDALSGKAYIDKSVSGTGIHAVVRGTLPPGRRQFDEPDHTHVGFAFYDANRYFTFTGCELPQSGPICDLTEELTQLHSELFPPKPASLNGSNGNGHHTTRPISLGDADLLERAFHAANGDKFKQLWSGDTRSYASQSEADQALCNHLAFWTGKDASRIDALFRQSGLYRKDKWERQDYRERTIAAAIEWTTDTYNPGHPAGSGDRNYRVNGAPLDADEAADEEPHSSGAEAAGDWSKPEPIEDELPRVQVFSEDLLPDSFRPLVADVTERMQVPMDYAAAVMVLCLAGAVNRRGVIQPKANDTGWVVVPNLWGGIVAPPGLMKSPVIQAVTRPLNQIQTEWRDQHEQALQEYERAKEEHELRYAAWRDLYKASAKKGGAASPGRPEDAPQAPTLQRLIVNDATFEALHQTMSENPSGVLLIRDELTGLLSRLEQEQYGSERAFYLQAWNGDIGHVVDRIGRGTIHVPHCCISMLGGIQPGRLRSYLVDALKDGPTNDGLIQRFQLLVWPDPPADWRYIDRKPNAAYEEIASQVFRALAQLDSDTPLVFCFDPEAQQLFIEWLTELESKLRGGQLPDALVSHLSKYRSLMPSLALLFELADRAAGGFVGFVGSHPGESQNFWVSLKHAKQAAAWCDYLESHARRVYSCIVTPQARAARELASHIKQKHVVNKGGGFDWFTSRDVYLKGWAGLDTPDAVRRAAEVLQDAHWLKEIPSKSGPDGGRPSNRWAVNPGVWK